ncbi:MAG: Electron-bifurcating [FeFe]-hydrogenase subunit C (2Fe2S protein) [Firmicutes bacterium]|nr:Electron-bifurcating [FeFe]-hydrogenase subunit C (2Fe2S protein) [Bacillota bacterium]MBA1335148.1 Electron-bifurcating [FeFe]-hydrogenase subunit C (2Fe2S protein) [Bacillota bacterium]MDI6705691.1 (2Fe-2S) ferredoxin domain-containing protein [Bacillota bacterium]MDI6705695.1 (2Fe-2S) ferredoxin domain-containing protein [Bacillota bacterium]
MKTIQELEEIRSRTLDKISIRKERKGTRIVIGMATCGIAAGARPVLLSFMEEVNKRGLQDVIVSQTGCIGVCEYEPIVEVYKPGEEKVTYVKMTPDKVARVVAEHIVNDRVVSEYTIGSIEK